MKKTEDACKQQLKTTKKYFKTQLISIENILLPRMLQEENSKYYNRITSALMWRVLTVLQTQYIAF